MQVLKDAATLGILILLALSVRIDFDGAPLEIDLNPPVNAAESKVRDERPDRELLPEPAAEQGEEIVLPKRPAAAPAPCVPLLRARFSS